MRFLFAILLIVTSCTVALSQNSESSLVDTTAQVILQQNRAMEEAFYANDYLKLASFYSDSAVLIGEKHEIKGRAEIDNYWLGLDGKGVAWSLENKSIEHCGDMAVQHGISTLTVKNANGDNFVSKVRFTLFWKKHNDTWLIEIDHYSLF